ncbi:MAG: PhnD/SsuA/transferrin family substrate-binding protein [Candidatus Omnitrophica bacterium]|nr:PhnD/SsuA/transferrin family substrate-binding protein [Candidatus Omnitrophota bacterium]
MKKIFSLILLGAMIFFFSVERAIAGEVLKFVIMVSDKPAEEAPKYAALAKYIKTSVLGIGEIKLETAQDYAAAAAMFKSGSVDGMFAGSFVAAVFIKQGAAVPVVRPVLENDVSTYKAIIVALNGTPAFTGPADLKGKKVAYCAYASSGEVFARSLIEGADPKTFFTPLIKASHSSALQDVILKRADYAIVKNLTYKDGAAYPGTIVAGGDTAENPNNTLILAKKTYDKYGAQIETALVQVAISADPAAQELKKLFKAKGFVKTTAGDFEHTYSIMANAKIDPATFNFNW